MKQVLLSADGEISVYCVPDAVADDLETYCLEFSCHWLHESPDAARYRVKRGSAVVVCYTEKDFIEYLNRYICTDPSSLVTTLHNVYCKEELPEKYRPVVVLHCMEGYSCSELAGFLRVSVSAVSMRLHRARKMLDEQLGRD